MTTDEILAYVRQAGIRLEVRGDRLHVEAPVGVVTPQVRDALARHKPALLELLAPSREFVTLSRGIVVPRAAWDFHDSLLRRGFRLSVDAEHQLQIGGSEALTDGDRAALSRWRLHVAALVEQCEVVA